MITVNFLSGYPDQTVDMAINEQTFTLRIKWNERFSFWSLSIYDRQFTPIVSGIKMVRDYPLTRHLSLNGINGDFIFMRNFGVKEQASFNSIDNDFSLVYLAGDEIDAAISESS
ncbi:hypothetical protein PMPD1_1738 [Paramixta manurensis]|uniref:Cyanophage baseplate Pam3 plug gp18 domain-containing protein n=1 Tax=Paramixta manurensis TaxID=2740817 RepID=A0A6M8U7K1_9GAMM|nr:hypothetical protein PMPD1_1738 [Erwiniaceae bacterium PD-1]